MSSRHTLRDAKDSRIPISVGVCGDSAEFLAYLNEATERLIFRGKFKGSYQKVRLCLSDGCITLPRQIASITDIALCNNPIPIRNQFFEFLSNGDGILSGDSCSCAPSQLVDRGWFPLFFDIRGTNKRIRVYPDVTTDAGKIVTFFGNDKNGNWIRSSETVDDVTTWSDGFTLTIADPFVDSTFDVKDITGIQKEDTDGAILIYEVDTESGEQRLLGRMEPKERVASYRRYFLNGLDSGDCCDCDTKTITAMAKLEFIPLSVDSDYLYIDNLPALKEMCRSILFGERDSIQANAQAELCEKRAIRELNHQKQHLNGDQEIAIGLNIFGSAPLYKQRIGKLM